MEMGQNKRLFPLKVKHDEKLRQGYKFVIKKARTERLQRSAVVNMQRLLNKEDLEKRELLRQLDNIIPENYNYI